ncbi:hypothetical protein ABTX81_21490 [Kitasatospora sp. NPDC097605]|uniref:hypothetical protein n=1 Tax=Kitasatospora sp. NPDC097605 TaxID=3157226 RepID=UPI00331A472A
MRNHRIPAALGLVMLLAGAPWQTGNWGGGLAAALLAALVAHGVRQVPGLVKRAIQGPSEPPAAPVAPAPVNAYDRDRAEIPTRRRNRRNRAGR